MITLTTLSDINFLPQVLSLYQSLEKHTKDFKLYYLCLDNEIYEFFRDEIQNGQYKNIIPVDIRVLHVDQDYLQLLKKPLSFEAMNVGNKKNIDPKRMEMMWCLASFFSYYVLETYNPDSVIYVDSDVYFYSDVQNIVDKIENKSIGIVKNNASDENNGKYNVSFTYFKNDRIGNSCLYTWRNWLLNPNNEYVKEYGQCGDQKYLNLFPELFGEHNICILDDAGIIQKAPWSFRTVKGNPDFFHFSDFRADYEKDFFVPAQRHGITGIFSLDIENRERYTEYYFVCKENWKKIKKIKKIEEHWE